MDHAEARRLQEASYPYRAEVETQLSDMNVLGHLNNVAMCRYYEAVRSRFLIDAIGEPLFQPDATFRPLAVDLRLRFLKEGRFPGPVQMRLGVSRLGRTSFELQHAAFQKGTCIGLCECVLVLVAKDGPLSIPQDLRMRLMALAMAGAAL